MPHLLQLLLLLVIIIASAKLAGAAANRVGQPAVFGEILAGLLLGPTLLNVLGWSIFAAPSAATGTVPPPPLAAVIRDLADVGVILLMFIAGLETDLNEMRRVGHVAFWSATGGVVLPLVAGALLAQAFGIRLFWEGVFIGTILTATSVSISAQTLMEIGALRSKEGSAILGAAVIDDVMGIVLLSAVIAFAAHEGEGQGMTTVVWIVMRIAVFFAIALVAGRYVPALVRAADRLNVSQGLLGLVLVVAFLYAWAAEYVGEMAAITGSYIAGVFFARSGQKDRMDKGIHPLTYSMFVPVFFVSIGLEANARELGNDVAFTLVLLAIAIAGKVVGCGVFARLSGFNGRQSLRVGVGMISRGEVGLIVASYGLTHRIIDRPVFSASVLMVLVTTMITPPLLRLLFPRRPSRGLPVVEETIAGPPEETGGRAHR